MQKKETLIVRLMVSDGDEAECFSIQVRSIKSDETESFCNTADLITYLKRWHERRKEEMKITGKKGRGKSAK
jgi:hypothetical protein